MRNEKIIHIIAFCLLLCGCSSTRRVDGDIISHQAEIDRLESELRNRDRAIDNAVRELEGITARSTEMEGTVDELIQLFDEYQRAVERLLRDYRATESPGKVSVQSIYDSIDNSYDSDIVYDCRFHMLYEGHTLATVAGYTFIGDIE